MPETQCSPHGVREPEGSGGALAWGLQMDAEPARPAGSHRVWAGRRVRGAGQASGVRPRAQSARWSPLETAGWVGPRVGPSPQTAGHQLQGKQAERSRMARQQGQGGRGQTAMCCHPSTAERSLAHGLQALHAILGQHGLGHPVPGPQPLASALCFLSEPRAVPGGPMCCVSACPERVLSCPTPPGPGAER